MVQEAPQSHFFGLREFILRHLPRAQLQIDIFVQRELPFVDQMQSDHGRNMLADRRGLKQRLCSDRLASIR
jgi:hypothetical protein